MNKNLQLMGKLSTSHFTYLVHRYFESNYDRKSMRQLDNALLDLVIKDRDSALDTILSLHDQIPTGAVRDAQARENAAYLFIEAWMQYTRAQIRIYM